MKALGKMGLIAGALLLMGGVVCAIANPAGSAEFYISLAVVGLGALLSAGGLLVPFIERRLPQHTE